MHGPVARWRCRSGPETRGWRVGSLVRALGLGKNVPPMSDSTPQSPGSKRFRVALSFPGEHRTFVAAVAGELSKVLGQARVLYDKYYEAEFAKPNLDTHLQRLYHDESELIVVFLSQAYANKEWPGLEWRAIRDVIKRRQADTVMLFRFDDAEVPGLFSTDGYVSIADRDPGEAAQLILQRLGAFPLETANPIRADGASQGDAPAPHTDYASSSAAPTHDVFLSHNSADKADVRRLCEQLEKRGVRPWLDEREILPGDKWQEVIEAALQKAPAFAIIVGRSGFGPWHMKELRVALAAETTRKARVIPVLLPSAPANRVLPDFLSELAWSDLRGGLTDDALSRLTKGIRRPVMGGPVPASPPPVRYWTRVLLWSGSPWALWPATALTLAAWACNSLVAEPWGTWLALGLAASIVALPFVVAMFRDPSHGQPPSKGAAS